MPRLLPRLSALSLLILAGALSACSTPAAPVTAPSEPSSSATEAPADDDASWLASFGDFEPQVYTGSGVLEIDLPAGVTGGLVTAEYQGDDNFRIAPRTADGEPAEPNLVNHVGDYTGTTVWGLSHNDVAVLFVEVESGEYTITLSPITSAPAFAIPASGDSDAVFISDLDARGYVLKSLDADRPVTTAVETATGGESTRAEANSAVAFALPGGTALIVVRAEMIPWEIIP